MVILLAPLLPKTNQTPLQNLHLLSTTKQMTTYTEHSNSWLWPNLRWVICLEGKVVEIPGIITEERKVDPTRVLRWFIHNSKKA